MYSYPNNPALYADEDPYQAYTSGGGESPYAFAGQTVVNDTTPDLLLETQVSRDALNRSLSRPDRPGPVEGELERTLSALEERAREESAVLDRLEERCRRAALFAARLHGSSLPDFSRQLPDDPVEAFFRRVATLNSALDEVRNFSPRETEKLQEELSSLPLLAASDALAKRLIALRSVLYSGLGS